MAKRLKVGIDMNEILRARWLQFDRFYAEEFGEEGIPEQPYVYDFFKHYNFEEVVEIEKELKEEGDLPEHINPIDYQVDENGEAPADAFLFKAPVEHRLSPKEVYNRFMYQDFVYEIHASAPMMYKDMDLHVNQFLEKYKDTCDFTVFSIENVFSIPSTLFFLSKIRSRFNNYKFVNKAYEMLNDVDVLITTDPEILSLGVPWGKKIIKLTRPYNEPIKGSSMEALQIYDLINNSEFEKIIKYKKSK